MQLFEAASFSIPGHAAGVYIAHPTSVELKSTCRYRTRTLVNHEHTKVGITQNFVLRENEYMNHFQCYVAFFPILQLHENMLQFEARLLTELCRRYPRSGTASEWFRTTERQQIADIVWELARSQ